MTADPISSTRIDCKTGWCREPTECKAFGGCRYHFVVANETRLREDRVTVELLSPSRAVLINKARIKRS